MKQLLIYDQPMVLNRAQHRHLRVKPALTDFRYAASINSVPLTAQEFADAARDYPIVFAGDPDQAAMPVALLGLDSQHNLFLEADGSWAAGVYIPAFLRRYPFAVAQQDEASAFNVCIDHSFLSDSHDAVPLFDAEGAESPMLAHALSFLADYQRAVEATKGFMQELRDSGLLVSRSIHVERPGQPRQSLKGFCVVDEESLKKLNARSLRKLAQSGALGLLYAHVMSLRNVSRLAARRDVQPPLAVH